MMDNLKYEEEESEEDKFFGTLCFIFFLLLICGFFVGVGYSKYLHLQCVLNNGHRPAIEVNLVCGAP